MMEPAKGVMESPTPARLWTGAAFVTVMDFPVLGAMAFQILLSFMMGVGSVVAIIPPALAAMAFHMEHSSTSVEFVAEMTTRAVAVMASSTQLHSSTSAGCAMATRVVALVVMVCR
jgi:hypothetical protein